jgi:hypothetical protein
VLFAKYYYNSQGKLAQQGKYSGLQVSVKNFEKKRSLVKFECPEDNNIKMNLQN